MLINRNKLNAKINETEENDLNSYNTKEQKRNAIDKQFIFKRFYKSNFYYYYLLNILESKGMIIHTDTYKNKGLGIYENNFNNLFFKI